MSSFTQGQRAGLRLNATISTTVNSEEDMPIYSKIKTTVKNNKDWLPIYSENLVNFKSICCFLIQYRHTHTKSVEYVDEQSKARHYEFWFQIIPFKCSRIAFRGVRSSWRSGERYVVQTGHKDFDFIHNEIKRCRSKFLF